MSTRYIYWKQHLNMMSNDKNVKISYVNDKNVKI